ncbi:glycosyltransferase family 2 protein [Bradyrhizobium sp. A5]|uniref:glycosyltransferase family 2 protein n=1 Tax=Bradyrhizobium sp. A5 TaxID=3133696 RepID=UPI00324D0968
MTPVQNPKVSIIIPAYNAAACLERAVKSVQAQTEQSFEIIVIDDCSSDATVQTATELGRLDPRVRLIVLSSNGGPSVARNAGIAEAKGEWLAILDADDAFKPDRLRRLISFGEERGLDLVGDDLTYFDSEANAEVGLANIVQSNAPVRLTAESFLQSCTFKPGLLEILFKEQKQFSLLKYVVSVDFLRRKSLRYWDRLRYGEDFVFIFEILKMGAAAMLLPEPLYVYSQQYGSLSGKRSSLSRTVADRSSMLRTVDELVERYPSLTRVERNLLLDRKAASLGLREFETARGLIREKKITAGIGHVARNPEAIRFALLETRRALQRRISTLSR